MDGLGSVKDGSVDCVITSPPYWQLRDYGWSGQWGLEDTFQEYLENLWLMMDEIWRILKPAGTVWMNLGDTYNTANSSSSSGVDKSGLQDSGYVPGNHRRGKVSDGRVASKCLLLIPHRFAIGCIDRGWLVRNDIIWGKRNAMPESVRDRFSKKHEYIFLMAKQPSYYFDLNSIKCPLIEKPSGQKYGGKKYHGQHRRFSGNEYTGTHGGRNPGDVSDFWDITTKPNKSNHYASFNSELIDKPILAGCPEGGVVLDPFAGTGTTLLRAYELGRKFIGIEGCTDYVEIFNSSYRKMLKGGGYQDVSDFPEDIGSFQGRLL